MILGSIVSVVNAMLVHNYGINSLSRAKTDKADTVKLANYGLDHWLMLPRYVLEDDTQLMLKNRYWQYQQYSKVQTMLNNNLISLLDAAFPDTNRLFSSLTRADGNEKWVDYLANFWHRECVCGISEKTFTTTYQKWCRKHGYPRYSAVVPMKAKIIFTGAIRSVVKAFFLSIAHLVYEVERFSGVLCDL